jgi:hypothetical protein
MSASHEWTDWHLTPNGWIEGSYQVDFAGVTERPIPPDRVMTVRWDEFLGALQGKMHRTHREQWRSDDAAIVEQLLQKFGEAPAHL